MQRRLVVDQFDTKSALAETAVAKTGLGGYLPSIALLHRGLVGSMDHLHGLVNVDLLVASKHGQAEAELASSRTSSGIEESALEGIVFSTLVEPMTQLVSRPCEVRRDLVTAKRIPG